jgi:hypothetical protein
VLAAYEFSRGGGGGCLINNELPGDSMYLLVENRMIWLMGRNYVEKY